MMTRGPTPPAEPHKYQRTRSELLAMSPAPVIPGCATTVRIDNQQIAEAAGMRPLAVVDFTAYDSAVETVWYKGVEYFKPVGDPLPNYSKERDLFCWQCDGQGS